VVELQGQTDVKADSDRVEKADLPKDREEQKEIDLQVVLLKRQKVEDREEVNRIC
jgi:hypothetical protein